MPEVVILRFKASQTQRKWTLNMTNMPNSHAHTHTQN